ncbi:MAG: hypothetical protein ACRDV0_00940 [Acidimicrobiales bacterium]
MDGDEVSRVGHLTRARAWSGVRDGDPVVVAGVSPRQSWVFVAHVTNDLSGEEWVEVRGGRVGEAKTRSFRPDALYPGDARRGSRWVRAPLSMAPRLPLG